MDTIAFGRLVASLRNQHINNKNKPWFQEFLDEKCNFPEGTIGKIERGSRANLEANILIPLANVLELTSLERKEFFFAAVGINDERVIKSTQNPKDVLNELVELINKLQMPAFILDSYANIVVANAIVIDLFGITPELVEVARNVPGGFNLMSYIFSPRWGFREYVDKTLWENIAKKNILFFRHITLRHRCTEYFEYLLDKLLNIDDFKSYWFSSHNTANTQSDSSYEFYRFAHPHYGQINYIGTDSYVVTNYGDIIIIIYTPTDQSTAEIFSKIISKVGQGARILSDWPQKTII